RRAGPRRRRVRDRRSRQRPDHARDRSHARAGPAGGVRPGRATGGAGRARVVLRSRTDDRGRARRPAARPGDQLPPRHPPVKRATLPVLTLVARKRPLAVPTLIAHKRDGGELGDADIRAVIAGAAAGDIPDYQLAALLMAIVWRGMTTRELVTWTEAMIAS